MRNAVNIKGEKVDFNEDKIPEFVENLRSKNESLWTWCRYPIECINEETTGFIIAADKNEAVEIIAKYIRLIDGFGEPATLLIREFVENGKWIHIWDYTDPDGKLKEARYNEPMIGNPDNNKIPKKKLFAWRIENPHYNKKYSTARTHGLATGIIYAFNEEDAKEKIRDEFSSDDYDNDHLIYKEDVDLIQLEEVKTDKDFFIIGDYQE